MTKRVEVIRLAVAVIEEDQKYLVTQRLETSIFPGLWEFPAAVSGMARAWSRRWFERWIRDWDHASVGEVISSKRHAYADYEVTLTMVQCTLDGSQPGGVQSFAGSQSQSSMI